MYARLTRFPLKPNSDEQAEHVAEKYEKVLHDLPGHESTVIFIADGSVVSVTTWDTEEHAGAVTQGARVAASRDLADVLAGDPTTTIARTIVHDLNR